jgi:hypothetical protein
MDELELNEPSHAKHIKTLGLKITKDRECTMCF